MATTTEVYAHIDTDLKENAESILSQLGISSASAIQMFYSQIVLQNGLPFDLHLPITKPVAIGNLTQQELDIEIARGIQSLRAGKCYSSDEIRAALEKGFQ